MNMIRILTIISMIALCIGSGFTADLTISNPSFEIPVVTSGEYLAGAPQGWTLDGGIADNIRTYSGDAPSGGGSQVLSVVGAASRLGNVPVEPVVGGATYTFSFYHKMYGSGMSAGVTLYAVQNLSSPWSNYVTLTGQTSALTNASWQQFSLTFTAPVSTDGWRFYIYVWPSLDGAAVWSGFDSFKLAVAPPVLTRGMQWVRDHPFPVFSWTENSASPNWDTFKGSGQNAFWSRLQFATPLAEAKVSGFFRHMNLHSYINSFSVNYQLYWDSLISHINTATTPDEDNAWLITDEAGYISGRTLQQDIDDSTAVINWIKANRPNSLTYMSSFNHDGSYLEQVISTGADAIMLQGYPYNWRSGLPVEDHPYFAILSGFRSKAKEHGLPLFAWVQTFGDGYWRVPSESEFRMNVFSSLASGAKGIGYFAYGGWDGPDYYMVSPSGAPKPVYNYAQAIKDELHRIGNQLHILDSTEIRFVTGAAGHATPGGLANWSAGAGGDTHITGISISDGSAEKKDGLIGFFRDDDQRSYFMLVNLYRGAGLSAADASLQFTIAFDSGIDTIYRFRRNTGQQETINLTDHQLTLTLPGGTGDLFSYTGFDTAGPTGGISINGGDPATGSKTVQLGLNAQDSQSGVSSMRFSNDGAQWTLWERYAESKEWVPPDGDGVKTVYVQYFDRAGNVSSSADDSITLDTTPYTIVGRVVLEDYLGDYSKVSVQVELLRNGALKSKHTSDLDASGNYSITGVELGSYDLAFSAPCRLRKIVPNVSVPIDGGRLADVSLIGGDLNGDNKITVEDLNIVPAKLDQVGDQ